MKDKGDIMKVELSIADDRELRQAIKDEIKGVVVSIARAEIKNILADVVREGILPKTQADIDKVWEKEIHAAVINSIASSGGYWADDKIKVMTREVITEFIQKHFEKGDLLK